MQTICLILFLLVVTALGKSDFEVLLDLKKAFQTSGQNFDSWDSKSLASNGCPVNWYGIICSEGHVISINLDNVGLVGNFSFSSIIGLTMLYNLSVSNNQLTGTLFDIGTFTSLKYLDLSSNSFYGLISSSLTRLKNLVYLDFSSNNFEGTIPSRFGIFEKLKYLDLHANKFSGNIMRLVSELGSVAYVDLSSNRFTGSLDLGLGNTGFISTIQYLNISHNTLVGELFAHDGMPYFDSLEVFDASDNLLVGNIPPFKFVVSLRILRLGSNRLSGSLPEALLEASSMMLSELDLSVNQLEGPIGSFTSATLKKLNISSNKLSGSLPAEVGHCAIIDISNNMISGNVSRIQSWGNYIEVIQLSSNSLSGPFPYHTSQFLRLNSLKISNNSLEGSLPPTIGTYPELEVIDISLNKFSGLLPPSLFNSTKLIDINLSGNNFTGPLPLPEIIDSPAVGTTQNLSLVSLDLSDNSLTGPLPPEFSKFHDLSYLNISTNSFEGSIPDDLPENLNRFDVSLNNFSGSVPENLRRFPDSSFHPGNSLLIFPYSHSSPKDVPDVNLTGHESHMKPAVRVVLIACLVGGAVVICLLCLLICFRSNQWQESKRNRFEGNKEKKGLSETDPSLPTPALIDNSNPSSSSFSFNQGIFLPSERASSHEGERNSSVVKKPNDRRFPESPRKDEVLFSPMSFLSSSNPSPSKDQHLCESPGAIKDRSPDKLVGDLHLFDGSLQFTAEELSRAPAEVMGRSCHGTLYKATLDSGHVLAIKWLREGIAKGRKEFSRELKKLGNIKHPNLVSIQGYYWGPKEHEKLIISIYIDAPCLALYLHDAAPRTLRPLTLDERLRVAVDVARCLNYLHNDRSIPHGNLKSSNILLPSPPNMVALLSDYSLHRILTPAGTAEQVLNAGALGYLPPEFASSSKPSPSLKSDVYAFGVILLELVTGKSSGEIVSGKPGVVDLTDWVKLLWGENRLNECYDRLIPGTQSIEKTHGVLEGLLKVALKCILPASERPDMISVYENLSVIVL